MAEYLGFAYVKNCNLGEAKQALEQVLELNLSSPIPTTRSACSRPSREEESNVHHAANIGLAIAWFDAALARKA